MLLDEFDPATEAAINPSMLVKPVPGMPKIVVSCFARVTFNRMVESLGGVPIAVSKTANMEYTIYKAVYRGVELALMMAGVGAPVCVSGYEEAFAMGIDTAIIFGNCGVLDRSIEDCGIIIPTSALRDEGTSFHYVPPSEKIEVNPRYRRAFTDLLDETGVRYTLGKCWTSDAIYRETQQKIAARKAAGCVCVDMECSAMAALARFRGKEVFQFFYAADNLDGEQWDARSLSGHSEVEKKDRVAALALELAYRIDKEKHGMTND